MIVEVLQIILLNYLRQYYLKRLRLKSNRSNLYFKKILKTIKNYKKHKIDASLEN